MVFVAVHIGAGFHSVSKRNKYSEICSNACKSAFKVLNNGSDAVSGVVEAITYLENEVSTNAGFGSNLNIAGNVECDASLMDGSDLLFGSVGAIRSIKNPIKVAQLILQQQRAQLPFGLIRPNFLVGDGAKKFAIDNGLTEFKLESEKSLKVFHKYKKQLDECHNDIMKSKISSEFQRFDTVGAVSIDQNGFLASGVSSGGIILKPEGRVGQASIVGSGCWTQGNIAATTSGVGEYLVRTLLARKIVERLLKSNKSTILEELTQIFNEEFFGSPLMINVPREDHLAGILGVTIHPNSKNFELFWAHSTKTMAIGYMDSSVSSPKSFISEMDSSPGTTINAQSKLFKLS